MLARLPAGGGLGSAGGPGRVTTTPGFQASAAWKPGAGGVLRTGSLLQWLPGDAGRVTAREQPAEDHGEEGHADENHQQVYAYLLTRNSSMFGVAWSIDDNGDIYLSGRLPLRTVDAEVIDQVLGSVLQYADSNFDTILQLGFGTAIRKEWAWRTKRGESLANLAAFKDFVERGTLPEIAAAE